MKSHRYSAVNLRKSGGEHSQNGLRCSYLCSTGPSCEAGDSPARRETGTPLSTPLK
jgi:hypothetical protein